MESICRIISLALALVFILSTAVLVTAVPPLQDPSDSDSPRFIHHTQSPDWWRREQRVGAVLSENEPAPRFRLPGVVVPQNYSLKIRPILSGIVNLYRAPGTVLITVKCARVGNVITMHADDMTINHTSVTVTKKSNPTLPLLITGQLLNTTNQSFEIELEAPLEVDEEYDVYIEFESRVAPAAERMNGLYLSSYKMDDGGTRFVATTQFSRTRSVRKVFPSFDEPNQKATFKFIIGRREPYKTLSNMDEESSEVDPGMPGWVWDTYKTTPVMPITVIAFVISDFGYTEAPEEIFGKPVKIWAPPPMLRDNAANFSSFVAAHTIKYFQTLFEIDYELPKIDSVAMPDFAAGAMENWGLNIYRTNLLLWYQGESPVSGKYSIGSVLAHELAHQWWGNLGSIRCLKKVSKIFCMQSLEITGKKLQKLGYLTTILKHDSDWSKWKCINRDSANLFWQPPKHDAEKTQFPDFPHKKLGPVPKFQVLTSMKLELFHTVTHAWWNDWWLTEGFASYFEYIAFQAVEPDFQSIHRMVCDDVQVAMDFDAGPNSVPIHGNVTDQFVENPSAINYQKGASLIRMMQGFLSQETFIKSLQYYLKAQSYKAVDQDVLFEDLTTYLADTDQMPTNGKSMKDILDTWTLQKGFPLVRVSRAGETRILVSQERFKKYTIPSTASDSESSSLAKELSPNDLWHIPVGYVAGSNPSFAESNLVPKFWIDKTSVLANHVVDTNQWIVLNGDARGYYRVMYDSHFEMLLKAQLDSAHEVVSIASRSQLVDDYFAFAYERYIEVERALNMTLFLKDEKEYVVWVPVFRHLRKCAMLIPGLGSQPDLAAFQDYVKAIIQSALTFVKLEQPGPDPGEPPTYTILRVPLLDWACTAGHEECKTYASSLVERWLLDPTLNPVPVDIQATVFCTAVANGTAATWDSILARYKADANNIILLNSLACSSDVDKLKSMLNMAIANGTDLPQFAAVQAIQRVAMNSVGRTEVIGFLEQHLVEVITHVGGPDAISSIVSTLSQYTTSPVERERLAVLIEAHKELLATEMAALTQYLRNINGNTNWMNTVGSRMIVWFKTYNGSLLN